MAKLHKVPTRLKDVNLTKEDIEKYQWKECHEFETFGSMGLYDEFDCLQEITETIEANSETVAMCQRKGHRIIRFQITGEPISLLCHPHKEMGIRFTWLEERSESEMKKEKIADLRQENYWIREDQRKLKELKKKYKD